MRKVVTLHAPLGQYVARDLIKYISEAFQEHGAEDVWISHDELPDLVVMARCPDVPKEGPSPSGTAGQWC